MAPLPSPNKAWYAFFRIIVKLRPHCITNLPYNTAVTQSFTYIYIYNIYIYIYIYAINIYTNSCFGEVANFNCNVYFFL